MDDMFDLADLCAEDSMLSSEFDAPQDAPVMRSRAYTWPTRPVAASVVDETSRDAGSESSPGGAVMTVAGPQLLVADDSEHGSRGELQLSPGGGVSASRKVVVHVAVQSTHYLATGMTDYRFWGHTYTALDYLRLSDYRPLLGCRF